MRSIAILILGIAIGVVAIVQIDSCSKSHAQAPEDVAAVPAAVADWTEKQQGSYGIGYGLSYEVVDGLNYDEVDADLDQIVRGFDDGLHGRPSVIPPDQLEQIMFKLHENVEARVAAKLREADPDYRKLCEDNLAASQAYMAENAKREGVKIFDNGIQYEVIEAGDGATPTLDSIVIVTGKGTLPDGTVFIEGEGLPVPVNTMLEGGQFLMQQMKVGDHWRVVVPPELAHGESGKPPLVGPNMALTFDILLVGIK